jgi:hypothetical protein
MEFASDLMNSLRGKVAPAGLGTESGDVFWPELHARFTAAHALACELSRGFQDDLVLTGGFANWKSVKVAGINASQPVNRSALVDGKSAECIGDGIAEQPMGGGRGQ